MFNPCRAMIGRRIRLPLWLATVLIGIAAAARPAHAMLIPMRYGGIPVIPDPFLADEGFTGPISGAMGGPILIRINPTLWNALPDGSQQFLLDHERGHAVIKYAVPVSQAQKEWDADTFAATEMMQRGLVALLREHMCWLRRMAATHPPPPPVYAPWAVQAEHVLAVMAQFGAVGGP